jgi:hypothetical protein
MKQAMIIMDIMAELAHACVWRMATQIFVGYLFV